MVYAVWHVENMFLRSQKIASRNHRVIDLSLCCYFLFEASDQRNLCNRNARLRCSRLRYTRLLL